MHLTTNPITKWVQWFIEYVTKGHLCRCSCLHLHVSTRHVHEDLHMVLHLVMFLLDHNGNLKGTLPKF